MTMNYTIADMTPETVRLRAEITGLQNEVSRLKAELDHASNLLHRVTIEALNDHMGRA